MFINFDLIFKRLHKIKLIYTPQFFYFVIIIETYHILQIENETNIFRKLKNIIFLTFIISYGIIIKF